jgi:hypothetical protein
LEILRSGAPAKGFDDWWYRRLWDQTLYKGRERCASQQAGSTNSVLDPDLDLTRPDRNAVIPDKMCVRHVNFRELPPCSELDTVQAGTYRPEGVSEPVCSAISMGGEWDWGATQVRWSRTFEALVEFQVSPPQMTSRERVEGRFEKSPSPEDDQIDYYRRWISNCSRKHQETIGGKCFAAREHTSLQKYEHEFLRDFQWSLRYRYRRGIAAGTEIGATERRSPSPILIILAPDFLFPFFFLSLSLYAVGCASGVNPPQSFKTVLSNALFNPTDRRPGPPSSAGRKEGGLFSFTFWLFMSILVTSFAQSSFPSPIYTLLGFHSMVYATVCFVAVLVFGQSTHPVFLGEFSTHCTFIIFQSSKPSLLAPHDPLVFPYFIAEDPLESSSLTPLPFQHTSQTPPSRLSAPISPSNPSDVTSHISMTPLAKTRIHLACTIPRAAPLPLVPVGIPFVLKFISRTVHL